MPDIKPSLRQLTEEQVLRAIAKGDEDSLILHGLFRIINYYVLQSAELIEKGKNPMPLLRKKPSCAIEKIALSMVAAALKTRPKKGKN